VVKGAVSSVRRRMDIPNPSFSALTKDGQNNVIFCHVWQEMVKQKQSDVQFIDLFDHALVKAAISQCFLDESGFLDDKKAIVGNCFIHQARLFKLLGAGPKGASNWHAVQQGRTGNEPHVVLVGDYSPPSLNDAAVSVLLLCDLSKRVCVFMQKGHGSGISENWLSKGDKTPGPFVVSGVTFNNANQGVDSLMSFSVKQINISNYNFVFESADGHGKTSRVLDFLAEYLAKWFRNALLRHAVKGDVFSFDETSASFTPKHKQHFDGIIARLKKVAEEKKALNAEIDSVYDEMKNSLKGAAPPAELAAVDAQVTEQLAKQAAEMAAKESAGTSALSATILEQTRALTKAVRESKKKAKTAATTSSSSTVPPTSATNSTMTSMPATTPALTSSTVTSTTTTSATTTTTTAMSTSSTQSRTNSDDDDDDDKN
jgi:hypothetical protein